jgi:hypothetical protein
VHGEQGETIHYLSVAGPGVAALGLRVDERAEWLRNQGARIESGPAEYD